MMKNRIIGFVRATTVVTASLFLGASIGLAAEQAAITAKVPLKTTPLVIGGKVVRQLEPGMLVNVLSTKGAFTQVELADEPSVKGWVQNIGISKNKDVMAGVANMNAAGTTTSGTTTRIAGSMGGVAKGFTDIPIAAQAAASSGKGKSTALKEDVGAVVKGKTKQGQEALDDAMGGDGDNGMNSAAADTAGKFKGKSASTLEKIEALKISESEISGFMKEGGLRSRLIR